MLVIVLLVLLAATLYGGIRILTRLENYRADKRAKIRKVIEIYDDEQFLYGQKTNIGNAFVYGTISATAPVRASWAAGDLMIWHIKVQEWTKHVEVTTTYKIDAKGNRIPHKKETVYYSWDTIYTEKDHTDEVIFKGGVYPFEKVSFIGLDLYETVYIASDTREERYALPAEMTGTLYTNLADNTISYGSKFMKNLTPSLARERMLKGLKFTGNIVYYSTAFFVITLAAMFIFYLYLIFKYML